MLEVLKQEAELALIRDAKATMTVSAHVIRELCARLIIGDEAHVAELEALQDTISDLEAEIDALHGDTAAEAAA